MFHLHRSIPSTGMFYVHDHAEHHDPRLDHVVATKAGDHHEHGFVEAGHHRIGPAVTVKGTRKGERNDDRGDRGV